MWTNYFKSVRLAYAVFLIDSILEKYVSQEVYVTYDVACTLHKHLKVSNTPFSDMALKLFVVS